MFGLALGYVLSWMGFADYDEIVAMFTLESPRLWLAFALSVAVAAIGFRYDHHSAPRRPLHPGIVPGSLLFGIGWAITGTCPGSALTQLGEGQLPAAISVLGIFVGAWLYGVAHRRFFRWDPGSCGM
ncbi:MAG TPA: YeeE/YedE thiosulfate transporter family protein [Nannocystaceae bacterium]|nr:YeeE/YedE thiosulfate transporter family protein [Nannocystaceae bacterium]